MREAFYQLCPRKIGQMLEQHNPASRQRPPVDGLLPPHWNLDLGVAIDVCLVVNRRDELATAFVKRRGGNRSD